MVILGARPYHAKVGFNGAYFVGISVTASNAFSYAWDEKGVGTLTRDGGVHLSAPPTRIACKVCDLFLQTAY